VPLEAGGESLAHARDSGSRRPLEDRAGVAPDVARLEASMPRLRPEASAAELGAGHLLDLGGKRLRPMCVALAARLGAGLDAALARVDAIEAFLRQPRDAPTPFEETVAALRALDGP